MPVYHKLQKTCLNFHLVGGLVLHNQLLMCSGKLSRFNTHGPMDLNNYQYSDRDDWRIRWQKLWLQTSNMEMLTGDR